MALGVGGLAQLLAGMWEFAAANTFGATGTLADPPIVYFRSAVSLRPVLGLTDLVEFHAAHPIFSSERVRLALKPAQMRFHYAFTVRQCFFLSKISLLTFTFVASYMWY